MWYSICFVSAQIRSRAASKLSLVVLQCTVTSVTMPLPWSPHTLDPKTGWEVPAIAMRRALPALMPARPTSPAINSLTRLRGAMGTADWVWLAVGQQE